MIRVVHQLKGRVRFHLAGLRGYEALARFLETGIGGTAGIVRVAANPLTGSVLIHYQPPQTVKGLSDSLGRLLSGYVPGRDIGGISGTAGSLREPVRPASGSDPWHLLEIDEVLRRLDTSEDVGLSEKEAEARAARYGENALPLLSRRTLFDIIKGQSLSWPVLLIAGASGFSIIAGRLFGGLLTLGVALSNIVVGSVIENRAEKSLKRVSRQVSLKALVIRDGAIREIEFGKVVPGDLLDLQLGSRIPADARLIRAEHLGLNEAALTGESLPQHKSTQRMKPGDWPIPQRRNMVYRGTLVVEGRGRAVVAAIGKQTVLGRLQQYLGAVFPPEAVAAEEIKKITQYFLRLALGVSAFYAFVSFLRGYGFLRVMRDALALIAGTVPSGLSTLALSAFALGHVELRKKRILIHRLRVLGNLASIQVVCFDKTGTLTRNRMTATELRAGGKRVAVSEGFFRVDEGRPADPLSEPDLSWLIGLMTLCNEVLVEDAGTRSLEGSSTEKALIVLAEEAGVHVATLRSQHPILDIRHRSEKYPFMVTIHRWDDKRKLTVVKGNPLEVLERCRFNLQDGQVLELEEEDRERLELENARMAGAGLRVLGLAFYWGRVKKHELDHPEGCSLIWAGLVGLADPLRPGAKEMIAQLHKAGIRTAVITGDQSLTAFHIGEELGLSGDDPLITMDAINLKGMSRASLTGVATQAHIFARLNPTQKLEIIQAYQSAGLRVAMVGDGFNDVLALKVADVGMAMGREGADLARHTADLVLEDDDIRKVTAAIADGRSFYENLRKSIRFLIVNNRVDLASELLSHRCLLEREAGAWQPLWTNLACLSLAMDPPEPEIMEGEYAVPEKGLLSGQEWGETTPDVLALMAGAGGPGAYGLVRYGTGQDAGRLFRQSLSINQLLYADACRARPNERTGARPPNRMLRTTLGLALGSSLVPFMISGLGGGPAGFLSSVVDLLAVALGGLLSRSFLDRPTSKIRSEATPLLTEPV
jgi:Ca2+-transporting ATPase